MDIKTLDEFTKLIDLCRKKGIKSVRFGDFQLELAPEALFPESEYKKKQKLKEMDPKPDLLREQFLIDNWSTNIEASQ